MTSKEKEIEFIGLIQEHSKLIFKICYIYASDNDELNDLYQETVINLWRSHNRFQGNSKYSTWLYRICLNTCVSYVRQKKRKPSTIPITIEVENISEVESKLEQIQELYKLINKLSKMEKAIIMLYLDEKSYDEIAEIMGITRGNVSVKLNRLKGKLKEMSNQ